MSRPSGVVNPEGVPTFLLGFLARKRGRIENRDWTVVETRALCKGFLEDIEKTRGFSLLGPAVDVYLNDTDFWCAVLETVWEYVIGGYPVIKIDHRTERNKFEVIICALFYGDDDTVLQKMQHDVYGDALSILVGESNRYTRFAKAMLGDDASHECWGRIHKFDHRTLQGAHDLLAAVWRYKHDYILQKEIPDFQLHDSSRIELLWLNWLRGELLSWIDNPHLVCSIQLILANQNQSMGYAAEARLKLDIMNRFSYIPWRKCLYQKFKEDVEGKC